MLCYKLKKNNIFTQEKSKKTEKAAKMIKIHGFGAGTRKRWKLLRRKNFWDEAILFCKKSGIKIDNSKKMCYHINTVKIIGAEKNDVLYLYGVAAALRAFRNVGKRKSQFYIQRVQK